jgi:hypothetical protein
MLLSISLLKWKIKVGLFAGRSDMQSMVQGSIKYVKIKTNLLRTAGFA